MGERGFVHQLLILIAVVGVIIYAARSPFFKGAFLQFNQSSQNIASTSAQTSLDPAKLKSLEDKISSLEQQVSELKKPVQSQSPASVNVQTPASNLGKNPIFIPLGSTTDPIGSIDWNSLSSVSARIDPGSYLGYTGMQLELNLRVNSGGLASARLFNASNSVEVPNSTVSTGSTSFVNLSSNSFTLPGGNNLYKVQVKNSIGDNVFVQNAKIRVNF